MRDLSKGPAVLLVEDNYHMRTLMRSVLRCLGISNVQEAENGETAWQLLLSRPPDLVLTDWAMGPGDGLELVRRIRHDKESPNKFLPVIMVSGHSDVEHVFEARDAGVNEYLTKPISAQSLVSRIQAVVARPRPYVKCKAFFGPDRRRRLDRYMGEERRSRASVNDEDEPRAA